MAWSEQGFRFAVVRLPTPGTGLDDQDRYALGSGVVTGDPAFRAFTYADRLVWWNNSGVKTGGTWSYADRLSIGRVPGGLVEGGGLVVELFETNWIIDPTWTVSEQPQLNDGNMFAVISEITASFSGEVTIVYDPDRLATVFPDNNYIKVKADSDTSDVAPEGNTLKSDLR
jgi:hypothetical protein